MKKAAIKTYTTFLFLVFFLTLNAQQIDSSFTTNGVLPYGGPNSNSKSNQHRGKVMEIQDDGKIVVGTINDDNASYTYNFYTYRYLPNGMPDTTFGVNGVSELWIGDDSFCNDLKIQDDGKIVMVGTTEYCTGSICGANQFIMLRLLPNGDIDSTFGTNGVVLTEEIFGPTAMFCYPYAVEILDNGQFYVAGREENGMPCIVKLNNDGSKDLSFADNAVYTDTTCPYCTVKDLLVDNNGKPLILVERWPTGSTFDNSEIRVLKLDNFGVLDPNFGNNGIIDYSLATQAWPTSFDFMDNDIIIVGKTENYGFCSKLNANGTINTQFQTGTVLHSTQNDSILVFNKVQVVDENNIIVAGYILNFAAGQYLHEGIVGLLDADGNWSPGFNQTGYMHLDYGSQATTGWTGKITEAFDVDFNNLNEIFITGKRNPIAGNTKQTLFLAKLKNINYNNPSFTNEHAVVSDFKVYPNPVKDQLYINTTADVAIFDISGRKLFEQKHSNKISLQSLSPGIYFLKTKDGKTTRFIKY